MNETRFWIDPHHWMEEPEVQLAILHQAVADIAEQRPVCTCGCRQWPCPAYVRSLEGLHSTLLQEYTRAVRAVRAIREQTILNSTETGAVRLITIREWADSVIHGDRAKRVPA